MAIIVDARLVEHRGRLEIDRSVLRFGVATTHGPEGRIRGHELRLKQAAG